MIDGERLNKHIPVLEEQIAKSTWHMENIIITDMLAAYILFLGRIRVSGFSKNDNILSKSRLGFGRQDRVDYPGVIVYVIS